MKYILFSILLIFVFSACEESNTPSEKKKITMLSSTNGFDDNTFNSLAKSGLLKLKESYDVDLEFVESLTTDDFEPNLINAAKSNSNLIFALGYDFAAPLQNTAKLYFEKMFSIIDYKLENEFSNVTCASFKVEEACMPLGYLAAYFAYINNPNDTKIAFLGGVNNANINQFLTGFKKGVEYWNKTHDSVTLVVDYIGSYNDSTKAYQMTKQLINSGVNVVFPPAGISGMGCFQAVFESNVYAIGYDYDCYLSNPKYKSIFLSSCLKRLDNAVFAIGEYYLKNGVKYDGNYEGNLNNQGVAIAPYHDYESRIHDSIKVNINDIISHIKSGRITF